MIRLVASDLDYTLMTDEREFTEYTREVIKKIQEKGIYFVPCSARDWTEMPAYIKENKDIPYVVCENGALIMNNKTEQPIFENRMSTETVLAFMKELEGVNEYWSLLLDNQNYCSKKILDDVDKLDVNKNFHARFLKDRIVIADYVPFIQESGGITKIHYRAPNLEIKQATADVLSKFPELECTSSFAKNIEVTHHGSTKARALEYVGKLYGVTPDEMLAFGDHLNDITMLQSVKYKFTPSNGEPELRELFPILEYSNNEDGVAKKIAELLLEN